MKICDPAVGSGHFLVSALNELISIKRELKVLQYYNSEEERIREFEISVKDDELNVTDGRGNLYKYIPNDKENAEFQKALFEEKRTIIENCLFGVDLNPISVEICRLRLWIELLKNAYYYKDEKGDNVLQTLPNIDINIKCGDSLASNHPVCVGRTISISGGFKELFNEYKQNVSEYKKCRSKTRKIELDKSIKKFHNHFKPAEEPDLFNQTKKKKKHKKIIPNAFEWMVAFPEVVDDECIFRGFDVIVGNPPYISMINLKDTSVNYECMSRRDENNIEGKTYKTFDKQGDIYTLFVERGLHLLREGGQLSYILPNKWEKVRYGRALRGLFLQYNLTHLIDFQDYQIFKDATTYTCIIRMKKEKSEGTLLVSSMKVVDKETFKEDIEKLYELYDKKALGLKIWITSSLDKFNLVKRIMTPGKYQSLGTSIRGEAHRGLLTGLTDAYIITNDKANELIEQDESSKEIIRPFLQGRDLIAYEKVMPVSCLIFIPKGFTLTGMGVVIDEEELKRKKQKKKDVIPSENQAWEWFSLKYPAIAKWLKAYEKGAKKRGDQGDYWWELRACDFYDKIDDTKIMYQRIQVKPCFTFDNNRIYTNDSIWFLFTNNKSYLSLLNSKLGWWLISEFCPRVVNGYQLIWYNFEQIPLPLKLSEELGVLATEAELAKEDNDDNKLEKIMMNIDKAVYRNYNLTYNDVLIIDPNTNIKETEYNN